MSTGIYSLIPEQKLTSIINTLHSLFGLPILLIDENGKLLRSFGDTSPYCCLLKNTISDCSECLSLYLKAAENAKNLGEAYIFSCHAELNHIAFPLLNQGELLASIIVGPFLMDTPDSTLISGIVDKHSLNASTVLGLYDCLSDFRIIEPAKANDLKHLMENLFSPLLSSERALLIQTQEKMLQQARVNETIQMYKKQNVSPDNRIFYSKENELLTKMRTGNTEAVKTLITKLIAHLMIKEGNNIEKVRIYAIETATLLSRTALDCGARSDNVYELSSCFLTRIISENNLDTLCYLLSEAAETYMKLMFTENESGNPHIRQALRYIADNYNQPITLESVSREIGLSPNHFSTLFRKNVGVSFREYLNHIRVEESKRLLLSTDYNMTDIAVAMGFNDQSYYCKVFKQFEGLPPGQYRNK